jgi:hypothetical protein
MVHDMPSRFEKLDLVKVSARSLQGISSLLDLHLRADDKFQLASLHDRSEDQSYGLPLDRRCGVRDFHLPSSPFACVSSAARSGKTSYHQIIIAANAETLQAHQTTGPNKKD